MDSKLKSLTVIKSSFFQLRQLAKIKPIGSQQHFETVIHTFVSTWLDYCNALYIEVRASYITHYLSERLRPYTPAHPLPWVSWSAVPKCAQD